MMRVHSVLLAAALLFLALPGQAQERRPPPRIIPPANPLPEPDPRNFIDDIKFMPGDELLPIEKERLISAVLSFDQIGIQRAYLRKREDMNMRRKGVPLLMCAAFSEPETGNFGNSQECSPEREGTVRLLLHLGADVNARQETGNEPNYGDNLLLHAIKIGNPFLIKIALDNAKIDVKVTDVKRGFRVASGGQSGTSDRPSCVRGRIRHGREPHRRRRRQCAFRGCPSAQADIPDR